VGERIGVPWLGGTDGTCRYCRSGRENLCLAPTFTGWDVPGGYAQACLVDEAYAYRLPDSVDDEQAAPLLCAGIIGYRALTAAAVPPGGRLGIYGFGGSAHLTAQVALHQGMRVHVLTRGEANQRLAAELGADSVGGASDEPPEKLDGAILFAPAGELVPVALRALDRGGTLAVAGIWLSDVPRLDYAAELFEERRLRSVTANTRTSRTATASTRPLSGTASSRRTRRSPTSRPAASVAQPSCTSQADRHPAPGPGASCAPARRLRCGRPRRPYDPTPARAPAPPHAGPRRTR